QEPGAFVTGELAAGRLRFAAEDPDAPENYPRVLTVWRANLLGSSGKGNEYFLKHLLGAASPVRAPAAPDGPPPRPVARPQEAPDELAVPHGIVRDWRADGRAPVPGRDFPKLVVVERDYPNVAAKMAALGPLTERLGLTTKGVTFEPEHAVEYLKGKNGTVRGGVADGRPRLDR